MNNICKKEHSIRFGDNHHLLIHLKCKTHDSDPNNGKKNLVESGKIDPLVKLGSNRIDSLENKNSYVFRSFSKKITPTSKIKENLENKKIYKSEKTVLIKRSFKKNKRATLKPLRSRIILKKDKKRKNNQIKMTLKDLINICNKNGEMSNEAKFIMGIYDAHRSGVIFKTSNDISLQYAKGSNEKKTERIKESNYIKHVTRDPNVNFSIESRDNFVPPAIRL